MSRKIQFSEVNTRLKSSDDSFYNWQVTSQVKNNNPNSFICRAAISHLRKHYSNPKSGVSFSKVN